VSGRSLERSQSCPDRGTRGLRTSALGRGGGSPPLVPQITVQGAYDSNQTDQKRSDAHRGGVGSSASSSGPLMARHTAVSARQRATLMHWSAQAHRDPCHQPAPSGSTRGTDVHTEARSRPERSTGAGPSVCVAAVLVDHPPWLVDRRAKL
jgi:hypothetical protein